MGQKVVSIIVDKIKLAKYSLISVDLTPDVVCADQLRVVIEYVWNEVQLNDS